MIHFDRIDSTNKWAKEHAEQLSALEPTWIVADEQESGYGRRGNLWLSPKGNLYATLFFCIPIEQRAKVATFPQRLALACAEVLEKKGISLQIKWPNDLLFEEKKCGGILAESLDLNDRIAVILGIGLNVNQKVTADQPSICLAEITGYSFNIKELLQEISDRFEVVLKEDNLTVHEKVEKRLAFKGERISAQVEGKRIEGICKGLTAEGKLMLELPNGELKTFSSGEIHNLRNR